MNPMRAALLALALLALAPSAAARTLEFESRLVAEEALHLRFETQEGGPLRFAWSAGTREVDFEFRWAARPDEPTPFDAAAARGAEGSIPEAPADGVVLSWRTVGPEAALVRVRIEGDFSYTESRGVHQIDPVAYAPGLGALAAALGVVLARGGRR